MKQIPESDFDKLFQQRIEEANFRFDEAGWDKMEGKLKKRERFIVVRNSCIVLLFLLAGTALYFNKGNIETFYKKPEYAGSKKITRQEESYINPNPLSKAKPKEKGKQPDVSLTKRKEQEAETNLFKTGDNIQFQQAREDVNALNNIRNDKFSHVASITLDKINRENLPVNFAVGFMEMPANTTAASTPDSTVKKTGKKTNGRAFALIFSAGPDYSSTKAFAGSNPRLNVGLLLQTGLYKNLKIATGLRYGLKTYAASAMNYELNNPGYLNVKKYVTAIDGSCNVLEIPFRLSYILKTSTKTGLAINAGLSSYLMLKEKYVFYYTPESRIPDFTIQALNENRHYLGVADVSATYNFKVKKTNLNMGLEPYLKLPLSGVGEGKVKLKSGGINFNLTYDLHFNKH